MKEKMDVQRITPDFFRNGMNHFRDCRVDQPGIGTLVSPPKTERKINRNDTAGIIKRYIIIIAGIFFFNSSLIAQDSKKEKEKDSKEKKEKDSKEKKEKPRILYGTASFYSNKFEGRKTANGEKFDQKKLTAACNVLPLGTWIRVTNLRNKKSVIVKINDRLHTRMKRIVDL